MTKDKLFATLEKTYFIYMIENINDSEVGTLHEEVSDDKKEYEIAFILKTEDPYVVKQALNNRGFSIFNESPINKLRLAYPIKKELQAYWGYCGFSAVPAGIKELSDDLKLQSAVLRFLIISLPKKTGQKTESRTLRRFSPVKQYEKVEKPVYEKNKILSNEALEKKLEEILQ
ncbi:MAG: 30S ribosomal protein S6 [Patescibacteria group bacterium]